MDPNSHHNTGHDEYSKKLQRPSSSELMSSAKLVAEAAKASFSHESDKVDKGRVAGATADLLNAASHYGKLDEKGVGKYVDKAENYLHQYNTKHSSGHSSATQNPDHTNTTHQSSHSGGDGHSSGGSGGYGEYIKMAQGLMNNSSGGHSNTTTDSSSHSGGHGHSSGGGSGGYGEYIKMAQGLMNNSSGSHSNTSTDSSHSSGGGHGGGGADYFKMAEGFLKKY